MKPAFADHFSRDSRAYAKFRPRYPAALIEWVAALPARRGTAWDCGTGNGQAATMLAAHFPRVLGTDPAVAQLQAAERRAGLHYLAATERASALRGRRVDLVTAAQAFHWFDAGAFFAEVDRVMAPGGALAVWCYSTFQAPPGIDPIIHSFYHETVGPWWPADRWKVDDGYRHCDFPIEEASFPPMAIEAGLTLAEFLGYVRTWSAVGRYLADQGRDPVAGLEESLRGVWGAPDTRQPIRWPIAMRAGRWRGLAGSLTT